MTAIGAGDGEQSSPRHDLCIGEGHIPLSTARALKSKLRQTFPTPHLELQADQAPHSPAQTFDSVVDVVEDCDLDDVVDVVVDGVDVVSCAAVVGAGVGWHSWV